MHSMSVTVSKDAPFFPANEMMDNLGLSCCSTKAVVFKFSNLFSSLFVKTEDQPLAGFPNKKQAGIELLRSFIEVFN